MSDEAPDPNATVTVEHEGRTLSGVGVTTEALQATMDARAPAAPPAAAPEAPGPSAAPPAPPEKLTRGQARFSELTQKAKDAEARAAAAERKAQDLEARLAAPPAPPSPAPRREPEAAPAPPAFTRPEPSEDEIGPGLRYETYGAYVRDQAQWVLEQHGGPQMRQEIQQFLHQQQFATQVEQTRAKGRAVYQDFDQLLQSGPGTFVDMPAAAVQAIFAHPQTEHLQYQIMKDGALAQRLAHLATRNPYAFGLELAALAPAAVPASTGRPVAVPPPPMQPVGSGSQTSKPSPADYAKAGNYEAYKAARAAERKGRR